jgi:S-adenosylmethionine uptake transporter
MQSRVGPGMACMIGGTFVLTCHDSLAKWMTGSYTVAEVMFYRSVFALVILALALLYEGGPTAFVPRSPKANLLRAVLATLTSFLVVAAYAVLPLADALAIVFASPIFLTALSVPMLGERVGWHRWAAVLIGFFGILVMTDPTANVWRIGSLFAIGAALSAALRDIITRRMGTLDSATNVLFFTTALTLLVGWVLLPEHKVLPRATDLALFAFAGALSTTAHWLIIKAFQLASASQVAPLRYLAIVYAGIFGFLFFDEIPGITQVLGAGLVVGAALYIWHRERVTQQLTSR